MQLPDPFAHQSQLFIVFSQVLADAGVLLGFFVCAGVVVASVNKPFFDNLRILVELWHTALVIKLMPLEDLLGHCLGFRVEVQNIHLFALALIFLDSGFFDLLLNLSVCFHQLLLLVSILVFDICSFYLVLGADYCQLLIQIGVDILLDGPFGYLLWALVVVFDYFFRFCHLLSRLLPSQAQIINVRGRYFMVSDFLLFKPLFLRS